MKFEMLMNCPSYFTRDLWYCTLIECFQLLPVNLTCIFFNSRCLKPLELISERSWMIFYRFALPSDICLNMRVLLMWSICLFFDCFCYLSSLWLFLGSFDVLIGVVGNLTIGLGLSLLSFIGFLIRYDLPALFTLVWYFSSFLGFLCLLSFCGFLLL